MLRIRNKTPFPADFHVCPDKDGIDTVIGVVKASFAISPGGTDPSRVQPAVIRSDEYWGEPGRSSIRYAGELGLPKPATDIVMNCHAVAPDEKPVDGLEVRLTVGACDKTVFVSGDRYWKRKLGFFYMTSPEPFVRMPIVYENAFGGTDRKDAKATDPRNPVGCGIKRKNDEPAKIPNITDPKHPIEYRTQRPEPVGFGYIAPRWAQRAQFAGTYDEAWRQERAPYLPEDFNPRFFNAAHPDLITRSYLTGGEDVRIINVHSSGPLAFSLPKVTLEFVFQIAGEKIPVEPVMDTLIIEPDLNRFSMVYRACAQCDKKVLKVETLLIQGDFPERKERG